MTHVFKAALAVMVVFAIAAPAVAQSGRSSRIRSPVRRPTTSPYLNLLRGPGGGGLGFDYYQRVRPQQDYLRTTQALSNSLNRVSRRQSALERELTTGRTATGHSTTFLDYRGYYPQSGR